MDRMLAKTRIFAGLSEPALSLIAAETEYVFFPAGALVLKEGDTGTKMFVVKSGEVRVFKSCAEGQGEVELAMLGAGECFGEGCILTTLPRSASVQAISDTGLFQISSMAFYHLYEAMPAQYSLLILNLARDISRRLRRLDEIYAACH